jgi:hypothetical protein
MEPNEKAAVPDWVNAPPIKRVTSLGELKGYVAKLQSATDAMQKDFDEVKIGENPNLGRRNHASSRSIILEYFKNIDSIDDGLIYVYIFNGYPVCLICFRVAVYNLYIYLSHIVSHPWYFGTLGTVVEFLLNEAVKLGVPPRIELQSLNEESSKAYLGLGFVRDGTAFQDGSGRMVLDPRGGPGSAKFEHVGGQWRKKVKEQQPAP